MANPITAILAVTTAASVAAVEGIEGGSAFISLWRKNQAVEHKYAHRTTSLELLASYGQRATKAKETLAALSPEVVAYLQGD